MVLSSESAVDRIRRYRPRTRAKLIAVGLASGTRADRTASDRADRHPAGQTVRGRAGLIDAEFRDRRNTRIWIRLLQVSAYFQRALRDWRSAADRSFDHTPGSYSDADAPAARPRFQQVRARDLAAGWLASGHSRSPGGRHPGHCGRLANPSLAIRLGTVRRRRRGRGGPWCPRVHELRRVGVGPGTVAPVVVDIDLRGLNCAGGGGFSRCAMVASWTVFPG